jgi:general secretion pathway protein G
VETAPLNYAGPGTSRIAREPSPWVAGGVLLMMLYGFGHLAFKVMTSDRDHRNVSNRAAAKTDLEALDKALGRFQRDTGRLPTHTEGLSALVVAPDGDKAWFGPYLKRQVPNDPWGNAYLYHAARPSRTKMYTLLSRGPDGVEGTADDMANK